MEKENFNIKKDNNSKSGFTMFDNSILEKIVNSKFSLIELSLLLMIIRFTEGYQRNEANLPLRYLSSKLNKARQNISSGLKSLEKKNVIIIKVLDKKKPRIISLNKNYETWQIKNKNIKTNKDNNSNPGFTKFDNLILEKILSSGFSLIELLLLLMIIRFTAGYQKDEANLSLIYLSFKLNIASPNISKGLKSLAKKNVIIMKVLDKKKPRLISLNKNYFKTKNKNDNTNEYKEAEKDLPKEIFLKTYGKKPAPPERDIIQEILERFGKDKTFEIFKEARLKNFKNMKRLLNSLDENGNIIPFTELYKKETEEEIDVIRSDDD